VLLRQVPDPGQTRKPRPHLSGEPDRVRPDQLVPPARRVLPVLPDRLQRSVRVHGHGDALPGTARDRGDRLPESRPVHVPRAPVRVHRARLDGVLRGCGLMASDPKTLAAGEGKERRWQLWALVPIILLVGAVTLFASTGGSLTGLLGRNPPQLDEFAVRRVSFKPGEIRIRVTNPQRADLTIGSV